MHTPACDCTSVIPLSEAYTQSTPSVYSATKQWWESPARNFYLNSKMSVSPSPTADRAETLDRQGIVLQPGKRERHRDQLCSCCCCCCCCCCGSAPVPQQSDRMTSTGRCHFQPVYTSIIMGVKYYPQGDSSDTAFLMSPTCLKAKLFVRSTLAINGDLIKISNQNLHRFKKGTRTAKSKRRLLK